LSDDRFLAGRVVAKPPHRVPGAALLVLGQAIPGNRAGGENLFRFFGRRGCGHSWGLVRLRAGSGQQGQQEKAALHG